MVREGGSIWWVKPPRRHQVPFHTSGPPRTMCHCLCAQTPRGSGSGQEEGLLVLGVRARWDAVTLQWRLNGEFNCVAAFLHRGSATRLHLTTAKPKG